METGKSDFKSAFSAFGDSVSAAGTANLELLRAVDSTVRSLTTLVDLGNALDRGTGDHADRIRAGLPTTAIDLGGEIAAKYEAAENKIADLVALLKSGRQSALDDRALDGVNRESVVEAFQLAVDVYSRLFASLEELRWAILEHDADLSETSGPFQNAEDLIVSLK